MQTRTSDGVVAGSVAPWGQTRRGRVAQAREIYTPLHPSLPLAGRLMRVLRAVIEVAVLAMCHTREDVLLGRAVAFQLIGDDHARDVRQPLEECAAELLRRVLVPTTVDEHIQPRAVLIPRPPQIVAGAVDGLKTPTPRPPVPPPGGPRPALNGGTLVRPPRP